jgi:hypothetical protein
MAPVRESHSEEELRREREREGEPGRVWWLGLRERRVGVVGAWWFVSYVLEREYWDWRRGAVKMLWNCTL